MKKRTFIVAGVLLASATCVIGLGVRENTVNKGFATECDHVGNHYTAAKSGIAAGTKEYWVCCNCHNHYLTNPGTGNWTDAGKAGAVESTDDRYVKPFWDVSQADGITATDIEGGIKAVAIKDKKRIASKEKVTLDGLSFTYAWDGVVNANTEIFGFYLHNGTKNYRYITEGDKIGSFLSFAYHTRYSGSTRLFISSYNDGYHSTTKSYTATTVETADGLGDQEGQLLIDFNTKDSMTFAFEKVDSTWYKITIGNTHMVNKHNYNVADNKTVTYVKAADMGVGADGKAYFCLFGNDNGTPTVSLLGVN